MTRYRLKRVEIARKPQGSPHDPWEDEVEIPDGAIIVGIVTMSRTPTLAADTVSRRAEYFRAVEYLEKVE